MSEKSSFFKKDSKKDFFLKYIPDWCPSDDDYLLVFMMVDGLWREVSQNMPKYYDMLLCDYLSEMEIYVPDYTQFLRIVADTFNFEYRVSGSRIIISFSKHDYSVL